MGELFAVNSQAITKHIKNIYREKELSLKSTCSTLEQVQMEGSRKINRRINIYNLDVMISVGYRISSKTGTKFRQWATKTLRSHIVDGYTINKKRVAKNYEAFLKAVDQVRSLLPSGGVVDAENAMELVKMFASTWLSLDAYDKSSLPKGGVTKRQVEFTAEELKTALQKLKMDLIANNQATDLFGSERGGQSVAGIVGNIFQTFGGDDVYPSIEEKAAHLLYFMVKNHPYADGNKRSGAFAFVWFSKAGWHIKSCKNDSRSINGTYFICGWSNPKDKEKMTGLILLLLN